MNFFISVCCLDSLGFLDNPWPGLQDIILAKLGADFLEPPPFNLEKVWKRVKNQMQQFDLRQSCPTQLYKYI